jgi:hypothetical protein
VAVRDGGLCLRGYDAVELALEQEIGTECGHSRGPQRTASDLKGHRSTAADERVALTTNARTGFSGQF